MKIKATLIIFLGMSLCLISLAQKPADMVGTWTGTATLEGEDEPNDLVLVLELKDGALTGRMNDEFGTLVDTPITDVKLDQGIFKFSVAVNAGGTAMTVAFEMKVEGGSMKGTFEIPDMGQTGAWEAAKQ